MKLVFYTVAGRLAHFLEVWKQITSDSCILETIDHGYSLTFVTLPLLICQPVENPLPDLELKCVAL